MLVAMRSSHKEFTVRAVLWFAMIAAYLGAPAYAEVIGTVVRAQGTWCDKSHQQCGSQDFKGLWRMYPVHRDSKLVLVGKVNGREAIVIRSRWGALETFDCSNPRELGCKDPLNLGRLIPTEPEKNVVTAFFDAVLELAADHPKIYDNLRQGILRTRGSPGPLSDGVVELREEALSLQNIFGDWDASDYVLELCPLDDMAEPKCPDDARPTKYSWDPRRPTLLPVRSVHTGLYRLFLCEISSGIPRRTPNSAELLVARAPQSEQLANDFRQVVDATRGWDNTDSTAPALRRAYLYTLAHR